MEKGINSSVVVTEVLLETRSHLHNLSGLLAAASGSVVLSLRGKDLLAVFADVTCTQALLNEALEELTALHSTIKTLEHHLIKDVDGRSASEQIGSTLESKVGTGTMFTAYMPVARQQESAISASQTPEAPGGSETILVVDDETYIRAISKRLLEDAGYSVFVAKNGVEALQLLSSDNTSIDLVLLDLNMPKMDGFEALAHIRRTHPGMRIIVTAGGDTGLDQLAEEEMPDSFLQKPYKLDDLCAIIRSVFDCA